MDANHASGIVAGYKAIEYSAKYANKYGICGISVFNSSHPGALSSITLEAIKHDLICIGFANADNLILSPGGKRSYFGTNPISIVAPRKSKSPFCLDMAQSMTTWNKLLMLRNNDEKLANGLAADKNGKTTFDPSKAKSLISIGDYKGFVLASGIEMLCSIMSGMPFGINIDKMFTAPMNKKRKLSQTYILIRTDNVVSKNNFIKNLIKMSNDVRKEPSNGEGVMMPNDIQEKNVKNRKKKGIPIDDKYFNFLNQIKKKYNIDFKYLS
jgi:ureidoglycolate dehydrogenase (NAD+)